MAPMTGRSTPPPLSRGKVTTDAVTAFEMPSLDVVRRLTDMHVIGQLMEHEVLTRAELASRTGISKPTISESIRRLGLEQRVVSSGNQTGGRGRSGTYYRLVDDLGVALAMHAGPEGVFADVLDLRGTVLHHGEEPIEVPCSPRKLTAAIERVARAAVSAVPIVVRAVSLSFADPVDQRSDRIASMPNSPFLVGELKPYALLARLGFDRTVVVVDNDTNFGALAESRIGAGADLETFGYLWLGAGIGLGVIINSALHRGWSGLAGEIWQTTTFVEGHGPMYLNECFTRLGLPVSAAGAIDLDELGHVLASAADDAAPLRSAVVDAVAVALSNAIALLNPEAVIIAGPWADSGRVREAITERINRSPITAEIREPQVKGNPFLIGAQIDALERARRTVLNDCL